MAAGGSGGGRSASVEPAVCNLCTFEQLRRAAVERGETAKLVPDPLEGGHFPRAVRVIFVAKDGTERDGEAWFAEVPEHHVA
jgi:hypothetical protein